MSQASESRNARRATAIAALLVLMTAFSVLVLRRPIPLDEVRYLEVLREMQTRSWVLLRLNGDPYAHKPPMMFWIASVLHALGLPLELALRSIPGLASCGTLLVVAALAKRLRAPLAPLAPLASALQASLLGAVLAAQVLLTDPLLAFGIWLALYFWVRGWIVPMGLAATMALLTKGPVALLFIVPLAWALAPLRLEGWRERRRAWIAFACTLAVASAALYGWAEWAGSLGGPEFRLKLLWSQTADRISDSFAHDQPFWFYAPLLLAGLVPCTLLLVPRRIARPTSADPIARLAWAVSFLVVVFSSISGKQPQYLLPLCPALALVFARQIEHHGAARRLVRAGAATFLALEAAALVIVFLRRDELTARYEDYGHALASDPILLALVVAGTALSAAAAILIALRFLSATATALAFAAAQIFVCAPIHFAFGAVVFPRGIEARIAAEPTTPLATHGGRQAGLYNWVTRRDSIPDLVTRADVEAWCAANPGGLLIVEDKLAPELEHLHLASEVRDLCRGSPSTLWRVPR